MRSYPCWEKASLASDNPIHFIKKSPHFPHKLADLLISVSHVADIPIRQGSLFVFEVPIMRNKKNDRLSSLIEWAKSTYGADIAHRVARESPLSEVDFWVALNKVRAAHNQKYQRQST